jgi:N-methylhydantoinase A/oxoprolinase/acetone carboxylase beta subunit
MAGALRVVTVNRGVDPRDYALLAFGGAGGLHATDIADELGIDRILVPSASGVLAALGLIVAPQRRDAQQTVLLKRERLTAERIAEVTDELADRVAEALDEPASTIRAIYELRYLGQSFELPVGASLNATPEKLRDAFEAAHEARYGYRDAAQELELVTIRVSAFGASPEIETAPAPGTPEPGVPIEGPAVIRMPESTVLVPAWWAGTTDRHGTIVLERAR